MAVVQVKTGYSSDQEVKNQVSRLKWYYVDMEKLSD